MKSLISVLFLSTLSLSFSASADLIDESAKFLSQDSLKGRSALTAGNEQSRDWILGKMKQLELEPAGNNGTYLQVFNRGTNLIGIVRPKNGDPLELPTVLIGAHYDHLNHCKKTSLALSSVCNGAADNAAAVSAVLGSIRDLADKIESPVAVVFWDAEEKGLLGSKLFVKHPPFDMSALRLYINLDIIGLNLFRGLESHSFIIGAETGGDALIKDVAQSAEGAIKFHQISYAFGHGRSDMSSFIRGGERIPVVFFTDGDGKVYHSSADEYENLNMDKVKAVSLAVRKLAISAAKDNKQYKYAAPKIYPILGMGFPRYEDAVTMKGIMDEVLKIADKNQLSPKKISKIKNKHWAVEQIVKDGPVYFGKRDAYKVGSAVQYLLKTSRKLDFIP